MASLSSTASTPDCTRTLRAPVALVMIWIRAPSLPLGRSASRVASTDRSADGTSHTPPPSKSMPRLRPRPRSETTHRARTTPDTTSAFVHTRRKSNPGLPE
jgi:hypothetical protein